MEKEPKYTDEKYFFQSAYELEQLERTGDERAIIASPVIRYKKPLAATLGLNEEEFEIAWTSARVHQYIPRMGYDLDKYLFVFDINGTQTKVKVDKFYRCYLI